MKKNLIQLAEKLCGDKAEETLRTVLKSIKFSEVKEISDTLFRYKFIEKVMEKIREIDERMFDDLKKDLFQDFGNFSINEDKTAESTINATVVPGGIRFFTPPVTQSNVSYQITQRPCLFRTPQNPATDSSMWWLVAGAFLGFTVGTGLAGAVMRVYNNYWPSARPLEQVGNDKAQSSRLLKTTV